MYDYAHAVLALLMPLIIKGFPVLIVVSALLGMSYFFVSYKKVGKLGHGYLLPFTLLRDGFKIIIRSRGAPLFMLLLFVFYLASYFYSADTKTANAKLVLSSCLIYFPLIFVLTKWDKEKLLRVMHFFIAGCVLQVLISFTTAFIDSGYGIDIQEFTYMELSFNNHPSYAALLVIVGLVFTGLLIIEQLKYTRKQSVVFLLFLVSLFTFYIILLSSKAGIVSLVLVYVFFAVVFLKSKLIPVWKSIVAFGIIGGLCASFMMLSPVAKSRFKAVGKIENTDVEKPNSSQIRVILWSASWHNIKAEPILGYGVGDAKGELKKTLEKQNETFVSALNYNCHNQYLETTLMAGFPALLLLLALLFSVPLGFKNVFWIPVLFVVVVAFNLLVESMLERQVGSILIVWLFCLLFSARDIFVSTFTHKKTTK